MAYNTQFNYGQTRGLTMEHLAAIEATAFQCRPLGGRGDRLESEAAAKERGLQDLALINTMRDGMLQRSEAAALTWENLEVQPDGSGRLHIVRSKTDHTGKGACVYLSRRAVQALESIQPDNLNPGKSIFGLSGSQISRRIRTAALHAGLGEGFSGGSPRLGMCLDLVRANFPIHEVMKAGRLSSPRMPAWYSRMVEL